MSARLTYQWYGFYHHFDVKALPTIKETRNIPQFGELWMLPNTCVYNLSGRYHEYKYDFQAGECVIGTGVWKNIGSKYKHWHFNSDIIKVKVLLMSGRPVWVESFAMGCFVKIGDCPP